MNTPPRWLVPTLAVMVAVVTLAGMAGGVAGGPGASGVALGAGDGPCTGTVTSEADGQTVISVQGAKGGSKKPAHLVGMNAAGELAWSHDSSQNGVIWSYDVAPLPNGNLFVTTTIRENNDGDTVVYEFNPRTDKRVWEKRFDALDTHDADLINGGREIVVANMRNPSEEGGENGDRIFVYNRTQGEVTWEWHFSDHFDESVGGEYEDDWTHVNDVDKVGDDQFLISPRNFDMALVINRTTKDIDYQLGEYGNHSILKKQHNPDYLEGPNGEPTMLVADSDNNRVVEYAFRNGSWERTWMLTEHLKWPRDADRLPKGNTLVVDSWHHRVMLVTPVG